MEHFKLTYFDFDGGRAEPTRITMTIGGIPFEDHRISFDEFRELRAATPFNAVPVLDTGHGVYAQSNAMNRYFGRQAGLYPEDLWQVFLCDEVMDAVEDADHHIGRTFGMKGDELKTARTRLVDDVLTRFLRTLAQRLEDAGGEYFAGGRLSVADLKVFVWVRWLRSGVLDHVPTDLVDRTAPSLVQHYDRVASNPGVAAYYAGRGK